MTVIKYRNPPQPPSGQGTFADNLVGVQLVEGGGLTQGNFEFTEGVTEKRNRDFNIGTFSEPISLNDLGVTNDYLEREILAKNFKVYPNIDLAKVTNFSSFGSLTKRISASIKKIINYFPAALEVKPIDVFYNSGITVYDITYDKLNNLTTFKIPLEKVRNPFGIDFESDSRRRFEVSEISKSPLRDFNSSYLQYSLFYKNKEYRVVDFANPEFLNSDDLEFVVDGNPFSGKSFLYDSFYIKPTSSQTNVVFEQDFDEIEKFLLNRLSDPIYTAIFDYPKESDDGTFYTLKQKVTWPLDGEWNLDIRTPNFESYVETVGDIAKNMDEFKTNLVSRFLTTGAFKEFDTADQKVEKILQIYGRSFDEVRKFIDGLANMNSVNYNVKNDIPSALLKNLAQTLGWNISISPISEKEFLDSVFSTTNDSNFPGFNRTFTPTELNYQYYRNILLNSGFLFRSKGTRKSIEGLLRLAGAPDALVEFNENIYMADGVISMDQFNTKFAKISGGTYIKTTIVPDPTKIISVSGKTYTGFTTINTVLDAFATRETYPVDELGYPQSPIETDGYYFQKGAGWFEQTPEHRSDEIINLTTSVFTGTNPDVQTKLAPFTYGEQYFDRYKKFPYMDFGFTIRNKIDNKKSYTDFEIGKRNFKDAGFNSDYYLENERFALNRKNVDLYLNPSQGILWDIWDMSVKYNFPISSQSLFPFSFADGNNPLAPLYPKNFSNQKIYLNPNKQTFFEFAQTFWTRLINARDRLYLSDGKTGGYPTIQSIYWKYIESMDIAGIPNNKFTYQKMIDYVNGLGDYWIRLVEQMIPATTIWRAGVKYENSLLHRQKFTYRRPEDCPPPESACTPCVLTTDIYSFDCNKMTTSCQINVGSLSEELNLAFENFLRINNLKSDDCLMNTIVSKWYLILLLDDTLLIKRPFFDGVGLTEDNLSFPSFDKWKSSVEENLKDLYINGFNYYIQNDILYLSSLGCDNSLKYKNLYLSIGIDLTINCI